jgi:branched-chain amino acid transport system substrate-binding protein
MLQSRNILIGAAAALVAAFSISACSSSSSSSAASTSTSPATSAGAGSGSPTAAAAGSPITLGVECSCSGAFGSSLTPAWTVFQDWVKSVNATGGLGGHQVTTIYKDNGGVVGTALTDAEGLISAKVAAIIDLDSLDAAWATKAAAANIPVIGGVFQNVSYYTNPDFYPSGQTVDAITPATIVVAKQSGVTKLGTMYCTESPGCQQAQPFIKTAGAAQNLPVVLQSAISATAPNYTAQCVAAKQAGANGILIGDSFPVIARVASDCALQGYTPVWITSGSAIPPQALTDVGLKNNLVAPYPDVPYYNTSNPAVAEMNAAINKYSPGVIQQAATWTEQGAMAWSGGLLLAAAVKNAGVTASTTVTPALVVTGLNKVSNETLGGFAPPLTFTAGKPHTVSCWYTGKIQNGKESQVGGLSCPKQ